VGAYNTIKVNGKWVLEHRYLIEQKIGRKLTNNEVVHHIDGNEGNNKIENLQLLTKSQHARLKKIQGYNQSSYKISKELQFIKPSEVAKKLCISIRTLANWRASKNNPLPFYKVAGSMIRYRLVDVEKFIGGETGICCIKQWRKNP
jgi:hypothetical protein